MLSSSCHISSYKTYICLVVISFCVQVSVGTWPGGQGIAPRRSNTILESRRKYMPTNQVIESNIAHRRSERVRPINRSNKNMIKKRKHTPKPAAKSKNKPKKPIDDLSLWIDRQQVRMFSGMSMEIYAIVNGRVLPYILDPNFEKYLPVIPPDVNYVNFTWKSGVKKYLYNFDSLQSFNEEILKPPVVSISRVGRVPKKAKTFSVFLPCSGNASGVAPFTIGLSLETRRKKPLAGTPLRLRLRKECTPRGPDPECDRKCANGGWCNQDKICQCPEGYMGQYCRTALCYPQCMNGGICISPGVCSCPPGYQGRHCEGGLCKEKCLNGGKCIQKDTCHCSKGFYGPRCEHSRCSIPCLNGGKCKGVNKCRCPGGFRGDQCDLPPLGSTLEGASYTCSKPCTNGQCIPGDRCICDDGWFGRYCGRKLSEGKFSYRSLRVRRGRNKFIPTIYSLEEDEEPLDTEEEEAGFGNRKRRIWV
ncbi:protein shifted-like isoform X3 [Artemia franciscana]|uniref:Wnt inhibitory factor 1 n=1 Tax=Artemia franciscana TaxID=6661 RepID=A0AA88IFQ4_ARTSF|nr:hypothetical protein QYM36_003346 [Artemia franciscana]KAK2721030.1 hypothetical protein QYM36_003346 [Artemia franciscana]